MKDPAIIAVAASMAICGVLVLACYAAAEYRERMERGAPAVEPVREPGPAVYPEAVANLDVPTYRRRTRPTVEVVRWGWEVEGNASVEAAPTKDHE